MPERSYTVYQVADLLGATAGEVADWIERGWLDCHRVADAPHRVSETHLLSFLRERGVDLEAVLARAVVAEGRPPEGRLTPVPVASRSVGLPPAPARLPQAPRLGDRLPQDPQVAQAFVPENPAVARHEDAGRNACATGPAANDAAGAKRVAQAFLPETPGAARHEDAGRNACATGPAANDATAAGHAGETPATRATHGQDARATTEPAAQVAEAILQDAVRRRATAIHLDLAGAARLRLRIDGGLHAKPSFADRLPDGLGPRLVAHLLRRAGAKCDACDVPVAGGFSASVDGREIAFRLVACPVEGGLAVVIHVDDPRERPSLAGLGLSPSDEAALRAMLQWPGGLLVVTGPAGSGAGATLAAMAAEVAAQGRGVSVVCRREPGPLAVPAARVLRASPGPDALAETVAWAARQDADSLVIDEIRHPRVALAATEAAAGETLVLARMHHASAAAAAAALLEMGLDGWELASLPAAVVAQASVRRLCPACRERRAAAPEALAGLGLRVEEADFPLFTPQGCGQCGQTGFAGRLTLASVLRLDGPAAAAIRRRAPLAEIEQAAAASGLRTLRDAAIDALRHGQVWEKGVRHLFREHKTRAFDCVFVLSRKTGAFPRALGAIASRPSEGVSHGANDCRAEPADPGGG